MNGRMDGLCMYVALMILDAWVGGMIGVCMEGWMDVANGMDIRGWMDLVNGSMG